MDRHPVGDEIVETIHADLCGRFYVRSIFLPKKGMQVSQHTHDDDHPTLCGSGSAQFWEDGVHVGDVQAGGAVEVKAGKLHWFVALEDATRLSCLHDIDVAGKYAARGI
jgi:quercetin dioxygenase-like cupin family protein